MEVNLLIKYLFKVEWKTILPFLGKILMTNLMQEYIKNTPLYLKKTLLESSNIIDLNLKQKSKVLLVGSGSSYNAGRQVQKTMQEILSMEVQSIYPFEIKDYVNLNEYFVIGISQGGQSVSTYDALALAKNAGSKIATLTGEDNVYIQKFADYKVLLPMPVEKAGPKTLGYTMTKLMLILLACKSAKKSISELKELPDIYANCTNIINKWIQQKVSEFTDAKDIKVIGGKSVYGDTLESSLKIIETIRVPTAGYEYDEFIHGIYNSVNSDSYLLFLNDRSFSNFDKLLKVLKKWTNHIYIIGNNGDINIDLSNSVNQNFLSPLFAELLSAIVPEYLGYNPSSPKDPKFHEKVNSKR